MAHNMTEEVAATINRELFFLKTGNYIGLTLLK